MIAGSPAPMPTFVFTNIPGRSFPSALANVAWTWTLRVASFTTESTAVIRPVRRDPGGPPSAVTWMGEPTFSCATCCCGTAKLT